MRQDPTFKDIFAYPFMVEELLRWFVAGLPGGRENWSRSSTSRDSCGCRNSPPPVRPGTSAPSRTMWSGGCHSANIGPDDAESGWLHLVLMIEVQGTVDHLMALRIRNYVDNHHMELWRGKRFGARDRLAPVLPIVIYAGGPTRWTAASRVIDLVTPTAAALADGDPARGDRATDADPLAGSSTAGGSPRPVRD